MSDSSQTVAHDKFAWGNISKFPPLFLSRGQLYLMTLLSCVLLRHNVFSFDFLITKRRMWECDGRLLRLLKNFVSKRYSFPHSIHSAGSEITRVRWPNYSDSWSLFIIQTTGHQSRSTDRKTYTRQTVHSSLFTISHPRHTHTHTPMHTYTVVYCFYNYGCTETSSLSLYVL